MMSSIIRHSPPSPKKGKNLNVIPYKTFEIPAVRARIFRIRIIYDKYFDIFIYIYFEMESKESHDD